MNAPRPAPRPRGGYTLLELLAALAILVTVITILGRIVDDTQRLWRRHGDAAVLALETRSVFQLLETDFANAIAATNLPFWLEGPTNDLVCSFHRLAAAANPAVTSSVRRIELETVATNRGHLALHTLQRTQHVYATSTNDPAEPSPVPLLANLVRFDIHPVLDTLAATNEFDFGYSSDTATNPPALPAAMDIQVELLSERDVQRASAIRDDDARNRFVRANALRYGTRVRVNPNWLPVRPTAAALREEETEEAPSP